MILFSGGCFVAAVWREMWPGANPPRANMRRIPSTVLIVVNAFLLMVSVAALIGTWAIRIR